jgi:MFS family permease
MGVGLGVASVASTAAGTADLPEADRGVAAGLLNSSAQLGTALGLAVTGPLVASAAPMLGYRLGFASAALIGVAGMVGAGIVSAGSARAGSAPAGRPAPQEATSELPRG